MTATAAGFSTGRKSRTYYNTGTRLTPVWVEITHITKESFDPGEQNMPEAVVRGQARDLVEEDSCKPAILTFSRLVPKGATDAPYTALAATYGYGSNPLEFAIVDDDITYTGIKGWRFWGKARKLPLTRDVGNFTEQQWEVKEITYGDPIESLAAISGPPAYSSSSA